jgi:hypothetical protein
LIALSLPLLLAFRKLVIDSHMIILFCVTSTCSSAIHCKLLALERDDKRVSEFFLLLSHLGYIRNFSNWGFTLLCNDVFVFLLLVRDLISNFIVSVLSRECLTRVDRCNWVRCSRHTELIQWFLLELFVDGAMCSFNVFDLLLAAGAELLTTVGSSFVRVFNRLMSSACELGLSSEQQLRLYSGCSTRRESPLLQWLTNSSYLRCSE